MGDFSKSTVYQIYVRSFKDSNDDGIGDINGITEKLDYLKDLGIDYIWTTPFFKSPQKDNGYDVADYMAIDKVFGTIKDVKNLIKKADELGIGLMFDMVFNHTSTSHEWFQKALDGDEKYQKYYIFKEPLEDGSEPTNWQSKFGGSAWEYVPHLNKYYLHLFDVSQADLNWDNEEVRNELKKIVLFWKEMGVKGFRFDVVNLISKPKVFENDYIGDGRRFYTDGENVHEYLQELVRDTGIEDMITVGEMSSTTLENCIKYSNPQRKELNMVFNFHHLKVDYKDGNKWELDKINYKELKKLLKDWQMGMQEHNGWNAVFWSNHDQPRVVSRFGDDDSYHKESAKMLATMIHLLRGTPYVYQGEELGMTNAYYTSIKQYNDVESINYYEILLNSGKSKEEALKIIGERSRDNGRTPMQWSDEKYAGFSNTKPWLDIVKNYKEINVEKELSDKNSILNHFKKLISLRKNYELIAKGKIEFILESLEKVFAYKRTNQDEEIVVLNNLSCQKIDLKEEYSLKEYTILLDNYEKMYDNKIKCLRAYESIVLYKKLV